ncbi:DUF5719 family protein [Streptomyces sp. NPDC057638]|uniref:DUF5719 family protein n=1 Tax=Streptomyces sp. NPDC057638 TaxID=3346190 RepID=UPI0036BE1796
MKRTTLSLIAAVTALAAVTGAASLSGGSGETAAGTGPRVPVALPVERSSLLCPSPGTSELAETAYTSVTPAAKTAGSTGGAGGAGSTGGTAALRPTGAAPVDPKKKAAQQAVAKPLLSLTEPGRPAAASADGGDAPALIGTATGRLAPGWSAQQTTTVAAGDSRGVLGMSCTAPDTEFWFPGASTARERQDYIHLTNPDDSPAVVDIELYGKGGRLKTMLTEGIPVSAVSSFPILLSTLTEEASPDVTVRVTTRSGRIGAVIRTAEPSVGTDWLTHTADPAPTQVLPGIPADATSVRLVAYAPGEEDAELKVELAGPGGRFVPLGAESLHLKSGMTTSLELNDVTKGEAGSLIISPASPSRRVPVVAALRVVRGKGDQREVAFIPATAAVGERATVADNRAKGSTLSLTAPTAEAKVTVTASAGTEGGTAASRTYTVKKGSTLAVTPPLPAGLKGSYALTVETTGGGPVHASRTLALPEDGIPMFTIQPLPNDGGMVAVPTTRQDLSVLTD